MEYGIHTKHTKITEKNKKTEKRINKEFPYFLQMCKTKERSRLYGKILFH